MDELMLVQQLEKTYYGGKWVLRITLLRLLVLLIRKHNYW